MRGWGIWVVVGESGSEGEGVFVVLDDAFGDGLVVGVEV
jgi:hypothetical protein